MLIGVVGAPNKGKSTFFSAVTMVDAAIANYPFTTVTANRGVAYVRAPCPHVALGLSKCTPKNSRCANGTRLVPVGIIDTPGLVPDAYKGRGLGNKFLDSIREADAIVQVVDATGKTDLHGNPCDSCDPAEEIAFLKNEIAMWIADIVSRKGAKHLPVKDAAASLSGLKISEIMLLSACKECGLDVSDGAMPDEEGLKRIARELVEKRFPIAVAFNKIDVAGTMGNFEKAKLDSGEESEGASGNGMANLFACSAAIELALRKAAERGIILYTPGSADFEVVGTPDDRQNEALRKMKAFLGANGGSGVQEIIDWVVYTKLRGIVVYPVEDEHRYSNHRGEVLPDAYLVPSGTTAVQLAGMVHTDLADRFIGAVDAKRHIRMGAEHVLENGDVVKIVAGR